RFVDADRPYHYALAWHNRYQAVHHQMMDGLMHGRAPDLQFQGDRRLAQNFAGTIATRDNAKLDFIVGPIEQGFRRVRRKRRSLGARRERVRGYFAHGTSTIRRSEA